MKFRKAALAGAALMGVLCLTGCSQSAEVNVTAEPTATVDPVHADILMPFATQVPEATNQITSSSEGSYIAISSEGKVTVMDGGMDQIGEADAFTGYYAQLREGDTGPDVEKMQSRLQELGYYSGNITGHFDAATKEALMAFELRYSGKAYGIATVKLQQLLYAEEAALQSAAAVPGEEGQIYAPEELKELQYGDVNENVIYLQQRLLDLGYFAGEVNGTFDYYTALAVMRYEAAYDRDLTGIATEELQESLYAEKARVMGSKKDKCDDGQFMPLRKGDKGADVTLLQQRLSELGYADDAPNGKYNTFTADLIKVFQKNCGLKANGKADEETLMRLYAADAPRVE